MTDYSDYEWCDDAKIPFSGLRIIESLNCADFKQAIFPRRRKQSRRWQKKYRKNLRNWSYLPFDYALQTSSGELICHPVFAAKMRNMLADAQRRSDA